MIFNYLKYLTPIWYFNLKSIKDYCYFPTKIQLEKNNIPFVIDTRYKSKVAQNRDISWTSYQQGVILKTEERGLNIWGNESIPTHDEYVFLRKNFHKAWVFYVLVLRLMCFKNPVTEIKSFVNTRKVTRFDFYKNHYEQKGYDNFKSQLIQSNPFISVVIPTLNRYEYLAAVFKDLENQTYKNFEVIVVDQTDDFKEDFYKGWNLDLKYWFQKEKALWKARNEAIQSAKGEFILLYDDDSLVENDWIEQHLKCLDFFNADLSSGVSISTVGADVPKHYSYFRYSDQLDTGNVLIKKEIFYKIGFFDLQFEKQRMGDGEYGLRCYLNGYKNISNHKAKRIHLKVAQGGLRQMGSWDGWRPKKLFGPRPVPSVLYLSRKYFGNKFSIYYILHSILPSLVPYKYKSNKVLKAISFILLPFFLPLIICQIIISWNMATDKLKSSKSLN